MEKEKEKREEKLLCRHLICYKAEEEKERKSVQDRETYFYIPAPQLAAVLPQLQCSIHRASHGCEWEHT